MTANKQAMCFKRHLALFFIIISLVLRIIFFNVLLTRNEFSKSAIRDVIVEFHFLKNLSKKFSTINFSTIYNMYKFQKASSFTDSEKSIRGVKCLYIGFYGDVPSKLPFLTTALKIFLPFFPTTNINCPS